MHDAAEKARGRVEGIVGEMIVYRGPERVKNGCFRAMSNDPLLGE